MNIKLYTHRLVLITNTACDASIHDFIPSLYKYICRDVNLYIDCVNTMFRVTMPRWRRGLRNRLQSDSTPVRIRTLALNIHFISCEYGGHSGRVIPVPIPNTEDKSACVPYCTEVRESSGTAERCCAHSYYYYIFF